MNEALKGIGKKERSLMNSPCSKTNDPHFPQWSQVITVLVSLAFWAILGGPSSASGEVLKVGMVEEGFPPLYFKRLSKEIGIYERILGEVSKYTKDQYQVIRIPQRRKHKMFEQKLIHIEPGVDESIRKPWSKISIYTRSFLKAEDTLVFHKGKSFPYKGPASLKGKKIGLIGGYQYPYFADELKNGQIVRDNSPNEETVLKKLLVDRIDLGLMYKITAGYYKKKNQWDLEFGPIIDSRPMKFRFHISKKDAMERFDGALEKIIKNGALKKIIDGYL
jgi:polar amino acid transport system substrate-binding protein